MKETPGRARIYRGWLMAWSAFVPLIGIAALAKVFAWPREQILTTMVAVAVGILAAGAWSTWAARRRAGPN